jgi:hypothetical protein
MHATKVFHSGSLFAICSLVSQRAFRCFSWGLSIALLPSSQMHRCSFRTFQPAITLLSTPLFQTGGFTHRVYHLSCARYTHTLRLVQRVTIKLPWRCSSARTSPSVLPFARTQKVSGATSRQPQDDLKLSVHQSKLDSCIMASVPGERCVGKGLFLHRTLSARTLRVARDERAIRTHRRIRSLARASTGRSGERLLPDSSSARLTCGLPAYLPVSRPPAGRLSLGARG